MPMNFPDSPVNGQTFTSGGTVWAWNGTVWNPAPPFGSISNIYISDTAPAAPVTGNLWWNSSPGDGQLYLYYTDPDSTQWVVANVSPPGIQGPVGPQGPQGIQGVPGTSASIVCSDTAPSNPTPGALWYDTTSLALYVWYIDPTSAQWVPVSNPALYGFLALSGGTLSGPLLLRSTTPTAPLEAAAKGYVDLQPATQVAPGGRLTFVQGDPRPSNAEGVTTIYYVPYIHSRVSVPASSSTIITMQIPPTGVVNNYADATTNPAAIPASSVHFGLFLWNNNGILTLTRSPAVNCATGGAVAPACTLAIGPNNMVVNASAITNGPAAGMGLYVGTAFTNASGLSWMRTGGVNSGQFFGLANTYNRLTAITQIPYTVNTGVGNRSTAGVMFVASANTGVNDLQRYTATWGFGGSGLAAGAYSGTFIRAGFNSIAQTPALDWYTIEPQTGYTNLAATVAGSPNLQPGCWTFYLGASDAAYTTITPWGRQNTEFSLEI